MAKDIASLFSCVFSILILTVSLFKCRAIDEKRMVNIVYLGSLPDNELYSPSSHHLSLLERVVKNGSASNLLVTSYKRSFNGFAAELTGHEAASLANMQEVVSVFPSTNFQLHTTRSWDFIGLNSKIRRNGTAESDIIVGVMDTGIWPESDSFKGEGSGPPPKKWKGVCEGGKNFTCNNKVIGARFYKPANSARDEIGHGSHTASTAAGNVVNDVSFYGIAQGVATGGALSARIATYKVCSEEGCSAEAILAAFDDAIADGVDIITVSLGPTGPMPLQQDPIAIGAFHASQKGILTTQSAGNFGPTAGSVMSVAPWLLSVAASTTDRRIIDKVVLGDGRTFIGASVNAFTLNGTSFPLIYGKAASSNCSELEARNCFPNCLDSDLVKGKIVLCDHISGAEVANKAGAVGSVLKDEVYGTELAVITSEPTTILSLDDHNAIKAYINSTPDARGNILKSETIRDVAAPVLIFFSSRGPNAIVPEIIKPDISAPGVTILAAYSPIAPVTNDPEDKRHVKYSILSGTSMSCPHAAGAAAYVKAVHPDWSPAAIKSSLMTTAWPMNATHDTAGEFDFGSGHINPVQAIDPGLVFEASKEDYIKLLCSILGEAEVRLISGDNSTCLAQLPDKYSPKDHNYPSLAAVVPPNKAFTVKFQRVVKNVGLANSTYNAKMFTSSTQVDIKVVPEVLTFSFLNEEKPFEVTVVGRGLSNDSQPHVSALLLWSDGTHSVRSPILIHRKIE